MIDREMPVDGENQKYYKRSPILVSKYEKKWRMLPKLCKGVPKLIQAMLKE
ncbi:hypothetical protein [Cylindrospermum stagnale]|uniref:hypothetical protein n=1 Tax=Cylindrospermum stagnale TaxID=142864 RepID=UPI000313BAE5|nr:hypothetical protein [Cylindrospermum stagnale]